MFLRAFAIAIVLIAIGCGSESPPISTPDAGEEPPADAGIDPCPPNMMSSAHGCTPRYATETCPPGTRPALGEASCVAVGHSTCPEGFTADPSGWGCAPILPSEGDACPNGTVGLIGETTCKAIGWSECPEGFTRDASEWGCAPIVAGGCTGATRAAIGESACVSLGACASFPPADATIFVDDSFADGQLDATHFRTIQSALDAATAGAVIAIDTGAYAEALAIRTPVTLAGRCADQVTIEGTDGNGIAIDGVRDVIVRNLSISGHREGVHVTGGAAVALEGVRIERAQVIGAIASAAELTISSSVIRSTAAGTMLAGTALEAHAGGRVTASDVEVAATLGSGLFATGAGSELTATRVIVRDTSNRDRYGGLGAGAEPGARVVLDRSAIFGSRKTGMLASGAGASITVTRTFVTGTGSLFGENTFALSASAGGTIDASEVLVAANYGIGVFADNRDTFVRVVKSAIVDTGAERAGIGGAMAVRSLARVEVEDTAMIKNASVGLVGLNGTAIIRTSRIGRSPNDGTLAIALGAGAHLELERSRLGGSTAYELQVDGRGARAILRKVVIEDAIVGVLTGGVLELEDSALLRGRDTGLFVDGAGTQAVLRRSYVSEAYDAFPDDEYSGGQGVLVSSGGKLIAEDSDFVRNEATGVYVDMTESSAELTRSIVRGSRRIGDESGNGVESMGTVVLRDSAIVGNEGLGLGVLDLGSAQIEGCLFADNESTGILGQWGTRVDIARSTFREHRVHPELNEWGFGVLLGGDGSIVDSLVADNLNAGIAIDSSKEVDGADVEITGCVITRTREDAVGFGHGLIAGNGARVRVRGTYVYDNVGVGIAFSGGTGVVSESVIATNAIGAHVQDGSILREVTEVPEPLPALEVLFTPDTRFVENGARVGAGEIPLPAFFE
jgi:hypothetical protein